MEKFGSGINIQDPQHCSYLTYYLATWKKNKFVFTRHGAFGMKLPGNNVDKLWIIVGTVEQVLQTGPVQGREGAAGMGAGQEGEAGGQRTPPSYQMGAGQVPLLYQVPHQPSVKKRYFVFKDKTFPQCRGSGSGSGSFPFLIKVLSGLK